MQGSEGMFIPECDREGRYLPVQCYKSEGYCWWVGSAHCAPVVDVITLYFVFCDMDCEFDANTDVESKMLQVCGTCNRETNSRNKYETCSPTGFFFK